MKRIVTAILVSLALLVPAGPGLAEDLTTPPTMPTEQAAARYLSAICPVYKAGVKYNRLVDRYDAKDDYGDRPHNRTRAAAKTYAARATAAARILHDPAYPWPESVAYDVESIAVAYYQNAAIAQRISKKKYRWRDNTWADASEPNASVRLNLGLPPSPDGC